MRLAHRIGGVLLTAAVAAAALTATAANADARPGAQAPHVDTRVSGTTLPPIPNTVGEGPASSGFWSGYAYGQLNPNAAPKGANDFHCKPKDGRNPVVLVHGTYENAYDNWAAFSPVLKKAGYCVFAPNYGRTDLLDKGGVAIVMPGVQGVASIRRSSEQLGAYIDRVRKATGSDKVDIIAHSQGGLVARHWIKFGGGADRTDPAKNKVGKLIMFGTPNHGTTLDGLAAFGRAIDDLGLPVMEFYSWLYGAGPIDQAVGSPAVKAVNAGRMTYPGIEYTSVATEYDEVVTPFDSAFIRGGGVQNIVLQHGCEADTSDHLSMVYSSRAMSIALRALDPKTYPKLVCAPNVWAFSF
ncbi:alpha/beta fold hydrolase [Gordonia sp. (in: high G+C Gram-positive bacteria)]|uniref:esterase/lipase family protein n=1 Tax=Gordonia sp. (in: high G+C Gram-positive bacteria) TaxID=84139 RepID=UPI00261D9F84|nr:alpha/beta fold hydrolase [Gordonia sp. (in: high G+C Gram-positive bacteria)]